LIEPEGVSIVSDVDDTIKHSNVPNRRDLFHNTFSREFSPIPGMAELYCACIDAGASFHFVSGSPWQLYEPLAEFLRKYGFPEGSFHLKPFRIRDTARKIRGPTPQTAYKRAALEPIFQAFPRRKFVLIGDAGEQDPLVYGGFLREYPQQILSVFIRALRDETGLEGRLASAFEGCPPDRWQLFRSPEEIRDRLLNLISRSAV
jgi:phosphatidate phosphatase APP1